MEAIWIFEATGGLIPVCPIALESTVTHESWQTLYPIFACVLCFIPFACKLPEHFLSPLVISGL